MIKQFETLYLSLQKDHVQKTDSGRRASVAIIFRFTPIRQEDNPNKYSLQDFTSPLEFIQKLYECNIFSSTGFLPCSARGPDAVIEMLFIKRAVRKGDLWSGHVAFPGGKQDVGESDQQTVEREVHEEMGVDLSNSENFIRLGRLPDRSVGVKNMIICSFVYLQIPKEVRPKLQKSEIAEIRWVPFEFFTFHTKIVDAYKNYTSDFQYPFPIVKYFPNFKIRGKHDETPRLQSMVVKFPNLLLPTSDMFYSGCKVDSDFMLWGLTLRIIYDLQKEIGLPPSLKDTLLSTLFFYLNKPHVLIASCIAILAILLFCFRMYPISKL